MEAKKKKTILISLGIILASVVILALIFLTEPTAKREGTSKQTAMLVEIVEAKKGDYTPTIVATGTVKPEQDIILSPQVSGEVLNLSHAFIPGGFVTKGETLIQIDPADYRNALNMRQSDLQQALADLNLEQGRQTVAQKDYQLLEETLANENKALVLRQPQLSAVKAQVEAARASVNQAELELSRTTIKAPFNAHILARNVNKGSLVNPGNNLGRLVGMDNYWIEVTVPLSKIKWLSFPDKNSQGSEVEIRSRTAWNKEEYRKGHLFKLIGTLEDQTRLARVLVEVPDPLSQKQKNAGVPVLMLGAFVEATIQANEIKDVFRINRDYIRKNETIWLMEDSSLRIKTINIAFQDAKYAYVAKGIEENSKIVTTNLATVTEGVKLRTEETAATTKDSDSNTGEMMPGKNANE